MNYEQWYMSKQNLFYNIIISFYSQFQYTHDFPLADQYFFVNGHMAYVESTMNDLNVQNNALFVLFVTKNKREQDNVF